MFEDLVPGKEIKITVNTTPQTTGAIKTIKRLMRLNSKVQNELNKSHLLRTRTTIVRIRAGNIWHQRQKVAQHVYARAGETWNMLYRPQLAPELKSVAKYITIEAV